VNYKQVVRVVLGGNKKGEQVLTLEVDVQS